MIKRVLTSYAERLNEALSRYHRQAEGVAAVGGLADVATEGSPNKMIVSLVNLEKEASGESVYMQRSGAGYTGRRVPLLLNIYIILAAVYEGKRYAEALSVLSNTLAFIQSVPKFELNGNKYTVELVPMSPMDLHNIWTTMGGRYHPSVICKLRGLGVDTSAIISSSGKVAEANVKT